jgi:LPXTG-motif cell wall-anchored protein
VVDPLEPTDPIVAPVVDPVTPTDPTNLGSSSGSVSIKVPTIATVATGTKVQASADGLAQTGSEAGTLVALGSMISLAGLGLVVVRRRGRHAEI